MSNNLMTLAAVRKFATGNKPLTDAQYASGADSVKGSAAAGRHYLMAVAYGVSERCIAGTDAKGSVTRLAADTRPDGLSENGWRSTVSKAASAYRWAVDGGIADVLDSTTADLFFRAYDSTAEGRDGMSTAVKAAATMTTDDALSALTIAAKAAVDSKAAARKAGESSKRGATPDDGSKAASKAAKDAPAVTVKVTWLQILAGLADSAAAETAALDSSALAKATALHAAIGDAIADANATMTAALATARAARKSSK